MSLNHREIDCVLQELDLTDVFVRQIHQPDNHRLVIELHGRRANPRLLIHLGQPHCRIHATSRTFANPPRLKRFAAFLRAHIRGGRIIEAKQIGQERIVKFTVSRGEEHTILWVRLWGGAANAVATDPEGTILDSFYRRPKRGEISGGRYDPEEELGGAPAGRSHHESGTRRFEVRQLPGSGTFNQRLDQFYESLEVSAEAEHAHAAAARDLEQQAQRAETNLRRLTKRRKSYVHFDRYREQGNLILSHISELSRGQQRLSLDDYDIELDPARSPSQNAEAYFTRYRKAREGLRRVDAEMSNLRPELSAIRAGLESLSSGGAVPDTAVPDTAMPNGAGVRPRAARPPAARSKQGPGLRLSSGPFDVLVGRNARENDALLRRHVRGNDWWFHVRDYSGSYVFVRSLQGKSVPLEVMLDAGNLAVHYSKAKSSGRADVRYTQVKYLRRPRDAKPGTVIPTQERTLHITVDETRIRRLREQDG